MRKDGVFLQARRDLLNHFTSVETEKGYKNPMSFDLSALDVQLLKQLGYTKTIIGQPIKETDRVFLGFFAGARRGAFLIHGNQVDEFMTWMAKTSTAYGIIQMNSDSQEETHFIGYEIESRMVYSKKLVLIMNTDVIVSLAYDNRLLPNAFLMPMLQMLHKNRIHNRLFVKHIAELEEILRWNLRRV